MRHWLRPAPLHLAQCRVSTLDLALSEPVGASREACTAVARFLAWACRPRRPRNTYRSEALDREDVSEWT
jgi:hypothetical protein